MERKHFISPTFIAVSICIALAGSFLLNIDMIINRFFTSDTIASGYFNERFDGTTANISDILSRLFSPNVATLLIWGLFGVVCYWLVSVLTNETKDLSNIFLIFQPYVRPKNFNIKTFLLQFLEDLIFKLITAGILIGWLYLLVTVILPTVSSLISEGLFTTSTVTIKVLQMLFAPLLIFVWFIILGAILSTAKEASKRIGF